MGFTVFKPEPVYEQFSMPWDARLLPPDHSGPRHSFKPQLNRIKEFSPDGRSFFQRTPSEEVAQDASGIWAKPNPMGFTPQFYEGGERNTLEIRPSDKPAMAPFDLRLNNKSNVPTYGGDWYKNPLRSGSLADQMRHANEFDNLSPSDMVESYFRNKQTSI